ncbi:MAG TPA: adenosine deaminase [Streptosporangiaceae bacterium]|jgi:adenosine deaminase
MRDLLSLPKANLHVHLESAIRPQTLAEIAASHGLRLPRGAPITDSASFFAANGALRNCLVSFEDFYRVALEYCADEAAEGTSYAEVSFTAAAHGERLGDMDMPLRAVLAGLAQGRADYGLQTGLVLDHSRRRPVARAWATLRLAESYASAGVLAIGLAGDEAYPGDPFAAVFTAARAAGLHVVHHAGEAAGPASIRQAITTGGAERLGHGFRVLEDGELTAEVVALGIPLEVCPHSNVLLGLVPSLPEHPLPRLLAAGLLVTVNTDIPAMTGAGLTEEYRQLRDTFRYDDAVIAGLARAGIYASFAPGDVKARLLAGIDAWLG